MRKRRAHKRKIKEAFRKLIWWALYAAIVGAFCVLILAFYFAKDLPDPKKLEGRQIVESTKIYDRTGEVLLYDIHGEEKRTVIPFDQMPDAIKKATLVIEDVNFYYHFGVDFKGILRAIWANIKGGQVYGQGGSTITQQFIKNSFLTPEKSYTRKIKEAILAVEMEIRYSKDEIFAAYLNQIPYGSNAYGVEAAAQTFFSKQAKDLTIAQSALLAALPQAPSYYSPYGSHYDALKGRQEYILDRMKDFSFISEADAQAAKDEILTFTPPKATIKAPHFVMYVKEYLEEEYGKEYVEKGGLKVYTTLDWDLQQLAEKTILEGVQENEKKYRSFNAALVSIDPKTGQILAMAGSKDYFAEPLPKGCSPGKTCKFEPNVNVAIRDRQPGSSFKPFAYAAAFKKGFTPETILFDLPTEFNASCPASAGYANYQGQQCYNPQNYDGKFRGPVSMKNALAQSLNVPSVKTLYLAGINPTINLAQDMGITTLKDRSRYGLALVLGGGEVKLLDMVSAFGVFAQEGVKHPKAPILKIEKANGDLIENREDEPIKVLGEQTARQISDILSDNSARSPVFGSNSPLFLGERPVAAKTGTTQEYRDAWTIGYTPSLAVGVWSGNNDNTPMTKEGAGLYAAAPLWNSFMKKAYELKQKGNKDSEQTPFSEQINETESQNAFWLPEGIENFNKPEQSSSEKPVLKGDTLSEKTYKIDKISGKLATALTPPELIEERKYSEAHCILFYVDKDNPAGENPSNPYLDPQFTNWEASVLEWAKSNNVSQSPPPTQFDDIHISQNLPEIKIISPEKNSLISGKSIKIIAQASAVLGIKQVDFFYENNFIGTDPAPPFEIVFSPPNNGQNNSNKKTIKAAAYDTAFNRREDSVSFFLMSP
jgi:1A family penicillin-binding protein